MQTAVTTTSMEKQQAACLVIPIFEKSASLAARMLEEASPGTLKATLKTGDIQGKLGETLLIHTTDTLPASRILLLGLGEAQKLKETQFIQALNAAFATLNKTACNEAVFYWNDIHVNGKSLPWLAQQTVLQATHVAYQFETFKSKKNPNEKHLKKLLFHVSDKQQTNTLKKILPQAEAIAKAVSYAKNLGNTPPNICTPEYLASQAQKIAKGKSQVKLTILEEKDMKKLKMGALLAVSQGSAQPAKLISLEYKGATSNKKPIVLVGKGITFDSGGLSLKPPAGMMAMKYDMCGAATVLAVISAAIELELPLNLVGLIACSENLPSGTAVKPSDIVTTLSGLTVEILNTDAEGRLVLCDALAYAERFDPDVVIDIATLTGAILIALGKHASGLMGNNQQLINDLLLAGEKSFDRAWQLPLWEEYQDALKSPYADMANITSDRMAGSIAAGCFLARFTEKYAWAHLDVAATAFNESPVASATGRPIPLLLQYLLDRAV